MKKVILLLIDSLMPTDLENATKSNKVKALKYLMDNGYYNSELISAFPTMTASVDATLMTGTYPDQHKIPGLIWYNSNEKRLIDYVNGTKTVLSLGLKQTAKDVLINLNDSHLSKHVKTIFEQLADNNKTSGSINFIIHRGRKKSTLTLPFLLNLVTGFSLYKKQISAPDILSIGAMHIPKLTGRKINWGFNQTIFKRFGINDAFAVDVAKNVIDSGDQPDFMAVYLPDHDHFLHKYVHQPLPSLERVDNRITDFLNIFSSWEEALKNNVLIIIGDHGQNEIGKDKSYNINLEKLLKSFNITKIGKKTSENDDLIIANNERMAYIYPLKADKQYQIIDILLTDNRIDFVAWKEGKEIIVQNNMGKIFKYKKGGDFIDPYGVSWDQSGDYDILDIKVDDWNISYDQYPDALARLYGALFSQDTFNIVITAKEKYEFITKTFPVHLGGGSHGSLNKLDSTIPLLVSGATILPKPNVRMVDLQDYIFQLLNINSTTTG